MKKVDLNHITPTSKKVVNLYYQLSKEITGGQYVIFFSNNIKRVDAYIGNKHIYQSHTEIAADWLNFIEHREAFTNNIAISKSDAGKKLRQRAGHPNGQLPLRENAAEAGNCGRKRRPRIFWG